MTIRTGLSKKIGLPDFGSLGATCEVNFEVSHGLLEGDLDAMSTGLLGFQSVEKRQSGMREYISPSRLSCWLACPLRFEFRYCDGIRTPTTPTLFVGRP
jgi:hypothetical protein